MSEQSPNNTTRKKRKSSVKQTSDVKFSDRGFAYAQTGTSKESIGLIQEFPELDKPNLIDVPPGIVILNKDTLCLEVSDPANNRWLVYAPSGSATITGGLGGAGIIGLPTDGSYVDGAATINPSGSIADAVDSVNEFLSTISGITGSITGSGIFTDTVYYNGTSYAPNTGLRSDGVNVSIQNRLTVSGSVVLPPGLPPATSGAVGTIGEFRWDDSFLYIKTAQGWARTNLNYF